MKSLRVASIQMDSSPGEVELNNKRAEAFIREAAAGGAELVVLPELINCGYSLELLSGLDYDYGKNVEFYSRLAAELGIYIVCGLLEEDGESLYNCLAVFNGNGELECSYRKMNLFPLAIEEEIFEPGREPVILEVGEFRLGLMICYDIRFPELSRRYLEQGVNGLIIASAFPFPRLDHWRILLQARAIENQLYLVAANRCGKDGNFLFLGNSSIIDPWGTLKASMGETDEGVIYGELNPAKVAEVRKHIPCLESKSRLDKVLI